MAVPAALEQGALPSRTSSAGLTPHDAANRCVRPQTSECTWRQRQRQPAPGLPWPPSPRDGPAALVALHANQLLGQFVLNHLGLLLGWVWRGRTLPAAGAGAWGEVRVAYERLVAKAGWGGQNLGTAERTVMGACHGACAPGSTQYLCDAHQRSHASCRTSAPHCAQWAPEGAGKGVEEHWLWTVQNTVAAAQSGSGGSGGNRPQQ